MRMESSIQYQRQPQYMLRLPLLRGPEGAEAAESLVKPRSNSGRHRYFGPNHTMSNVNLRQGFSGHQFAASLKQAERWASELDHSSCPSKRVSKTRTRTRLPCPAGGPPGCLGESNIMPQHNVVTQGLQAGPGEPFPAMASDLGAASPRSPKYRTRKNGMTGQTHHMGPGLAMVLPGKSLVVSVAITRLQMGWQSGLKWCQCHVVGIVWVSGVMLYRTSLSVV